MKERTRNKIIIQDVGDPNVHLTMNFHRDVVDIHRTTLGDGCRSHKTLAVIEYEELNRQSAL